MKKCLDIYQHVELACGFYDGFWSRYMHKNFNYVGFSNLDEYRNVEHWFSF